MLGSGSKTQVVPRAESVNHAPSKEPELKKTPQPKKRKVRESATSLEEKTPDAARGHSQAAQNQKPAKKRKAAAAKAAEGQTQNLLPEQSVKRLHQGKAEKLEKQKLPPKNQLKTSAANHRRCFTVSLVPQINSSLVSHSAA